MRKGQLFALCGCMFVINTGISIVFGLMPLYLTFLGADARSAGSILAVAYLALAASTLLGGYLSTRLQRRRELLIAGGVLAAPLAWSLGRVTGIGPLLVATSCLWFVTGITLTMTNILAGLLAAPERRGRSFGLLSLGAGLGLFFGSLVSGPIVDRWGYATQFGLLAAMYLVIPCLGLCLRDKAESRQRGAQAAQVRHVVRNRTFAVLFGASIIGQASNVLIALGRPLLMQDLRLDATTITTAAAVGSLVSLPLPLVVGRLADRIGRKPVILVCFLATPLGLLALTAASALWQFWVAGILQTILGVHMVASSALVTDLFADDALSTALALLNATIWIGIVAGLSAGSLAITRLGMTPTLVLSVVVSLVAIGLLVPIRDTRRTERATQASGRCTTRV